MKAYWLTKADQGAGSYYALYRTKKGAVSEHSRHHLGSISGYPSHVTDFCTYDFEHVTGFKLEAGEIAKVRFKVERV